MPWVQREAGIITGVYNRRQPGYAEELLADDDAEVLAFVNRTRPDPITVDDIFELGKAKNLWTETDRPKK